MCLRLQPLRLTVLMPQRLQLRRRLPPLHVNPVPNRFAATVVESLALGGYQRIRAITSHGLTFEALLSRRAIEHAPQPGEAVAVSFAAAAVRAYPIHSRSKDEEVP